MCTKACLSFTQRQLSALDVTGKRVLEVGSRVYNGGVRADIEKLGPAEYVGVDLEPGPGVDVACKIEHLTERFGPGSFDLVVSTEVIEHVRDWRSAISNLKRVCRPGGAILVTTRSLGFPYHGYPYDYWRYEQVDMRLIFSDCQMLAIESDPEVPGVFVKVKVPAVLQEMDLAAIELYSIVLRRRVRDVSDQDLTALLLLRERARGALRLKALQLRHAAGTALSLAGLR